MSCKNKAYRVCDTVQQLAGVTTLSNAIQPHPRDIKRNPTDAVERLIHMWPSLYPNRVAALAHLLCELSISWDAKWEDGCLVPSWTRSDQERDYNDPLAFHQDRAKMRLAEDPDDTFAQEQYEEMKRISDNSDALSKDTSGVPSLYRWDVRGDSPLLNTPDDITPEWESVVIETASKILETEPGEWVVSKTKREKNYRAIENAWEWVKTRINARKVLEKHRKPEGGYSHKNYVLMKNSGSGRSAYYTAVHPATGEFLWKTSTWTHEQNGTSAVANVVCFKKRKDLIDYLDHEVEESKGVYQWGYTRELAEWEALFLLYSERSRKIQYRSLSGDSGYSTYTVTGFAGRYIYASGRRFDIATGRFESVLDSPSNDEKMRALKQSAMTEEIISRIRDEPLNYQRQEERPRIYGYENIARQHLLTICAQ